MEITHEELAAHLSQKAGKPLPVYLVHGDEYLCKDTARAILDALVPAEQRDFLYEEFDGGREGASTVLHALFTFPMFPGVKAVAWTDSRVFTSGATADDLLSRGRQARDAGEEAKAARIFLDFLTALKIAPEDLPVSDPFSALGESVNKETDGPWIIQALSLIREKGMAPGDSGDDADRVLDALTRGAPGKNVLLITSPTADKRKKLYKHIKEIGLVVDCTVPDGLRMADREARGRELARIVDQVLSPLGKTLEKPALAALTERLGPELRGFASALEKLASFTGDRKRITVRDVEGAVKSEKIDPVFVFTNALFERRLDESLSILSGLLGGSYHPLQVLTAFVNQVRKFLVAREFLKSPHARGWSAAMRFPEFSSRVLPGLKEFDEEAKGLFSGWLEEGGATAKGKKKKEETDLVLSRGGSPYPAFLALQTAGKLGEKELLKFLDLALSADRKMKSSGQDPRIILEGLVLSVCSGKEG